MTRRLSEIVEVPAGFRPAVRIPEDLIDPQVNRELLAGFVPTDATVEIIAQVVQSMAVNHTVRARLFHGTFGTGKSDVMLVLANLFQCAPDDPALQPLFARLRKIAEARVEAVVRRLRERKPYLVVLLRGSREVSFQSLVLYHLEQALRQAGLAELLGTTRYAAALDQIAVWEQEHPEVLHRFVGHLESSEMPSLALLRDRLASPMADEAFRIFETTFRRATGTHFQILEFQQPHQAFSAVAAALVARGSHSGVLLIIDEGHEFLDRMARSPDALREALMLQNLAEAAVASQADQLHLFFVALEPFAAAKAMSDASPTVADIIEKVGGRFTQHALQIQRGEELIRGALRLTGSVGDYLPPGQRDQLTRRAEAYWRQRGQTRDWVREVVIDGAFPLHPVTVAALPELNQRVAQSTRTMFQFLKDEHGLRRFLEQTPLQSAHPSWSNLLTVDELYDYFESSIGERFDDVQRVMERATAAFRTFTVDTALLRRVMRVLALHAVVPATVEPTLDGLCWALNLPDDARAALQHAVALLVEQDLVEPPLDEVNGEYRLPIGGLVSQSRIARAIREADLQLGSGVTIDWLNRAGMLPAELPATRYNQAHASQRSFAARYVPPDWLRADQPPPGLVRKLQDAPQHGVVWYVVTDSEEARQQALLDAARLSGRPELRRALFAVIAQPSDVLARLRRLEVIRAARSNSQLSELEREHLGDSGQRWRDAQTALSAAVALLRVHDRWTWFAGGHQQPLHGGAELLASQIMEQVFPDTPRHTIAQHLKSEPLTKLPKALDSALHAMLAPPVRVKRGGKQAEHAIITQGAVELGVMRLSGSNGADDLYEPCRPEPSYQASRKIWGELEQIARGARWEDVLKCLRQPPYGLSDAVLLVFVTAFLLVRRDEISIRLRGAVVTLSTDELLKLVCGPSPADYRVELRPLGDAERQWLQLLATTTDTTRDGANQRLAERIAGTLRAWPQRHRWPVFLKTLDAGRLAVIAPDAPDAARTAVLALIGAIAAEPGDALPNCLGAELAACCGLHGPPADWTPAAVEDARAPLADVLQLLRQLPERAEAYAVRQVAAPFDVDVDDAATTWQRLYDWRIRILLSTQSTQSLGNAARRLHQLLNSPNGSVRQQILTSFSNDAALLGSYDGWSSLTQLDRLVQAVRQAREELVLRWQDSADSAARWRSGVAGQISGTSEVAITEDQLGLRLVQWASQAQLPAIAPQLDPALLEVLYPELDAPRRARLAVLLHHRDADAAGWGKAASETLAQLCEAPQEKSAALAPALTRVAQALEDAGTLGERLRRQLLGHVSRACGAAPDAALDDVLPGWLAAHAIPAENDLDEPSRHVLAALAEPDAATALLDQLPRSLAGLGKPWHQWRRWADVVAYQAQLSQAIITIAGYRPLTPATTDWLDAIVRLVDGQQVARGRELGGYAARTRDALLRWRDALGLPALVATYTAADLARLDPAAPAWQHEALALLLGLGSDAAAARHLTDTLPAVLGVSLDAHPPDGAALERLTASFAALRTLGSHLERRLARGIVNAICQTTVELEDLRQAQLVLRRWLDERVALPDPRLSRAAAALANAIHSDAPHEAWLRRLPQHVLGAQRDYQHWRDEREWQEYLAALDRAARDIERHRPGKPSPQVVELWQQVSGALSGLSREDRHWLAQQLQQSMNRQGGT
ncbi:MAG: hypothetical protein KGS47_12315 [Chloroflexi bacterium]|nr:hypothetical protein [Chloroflexota bacterium]